MTQTQKTMKNIVFDLAGVVFARNEERCPQELMQFFSFINSGEPMPPFWNDYDRGTATIDDSAFAKSMMLRAIEYQEEIEPTKRLICDLRKAGYRLFVLSNMSLEYIEFLRRKEVYAYFDFEVISCETHYIKPEKEIYEYLLSQYGLVADETLFIDDRAENVEAAALLGIKPFHFDRKSPDSSCRQLREMLL